MTDSYIIVEAMTPSNLQGFVNLKIKEGYEPVGGIAFVKNPYGTDQYFQAIFKRPKEIINEASIKH
jgi:hypothetical protein